MALAFTAGAFFGMTIQAGTPRHAAAQATAAPWLPLDWVTMPFATSLSVMERMAFEEELCPRPGVQGCGGQDRRPVDPRGDARVGREDRFPAGGLVDGRFGGWGSAHLAHFGLGKACRFLRFSAFFASVKEALWHVDTACVRRTPQGRYWYALAIESLILDRAAGSDTLDVPLH